MNMVRLAGFWSERFQTWGARRHTVLCVALCLNVKPRNENLSVYYLVMDERLQGLRPIYMFSCLSRMNTYPTSGNFGWLDTIIASKNHNSCFHFYFLTRIGNQMVCFGNAGDGDDGFVHRALVSLRHSRDALLKCQFQSKIPYNQWIQKTSGVLYWTVPKWRPVESWTGYFILIRWKSCEREYQWDHSGLSYTVQATVLAL